MESTVKKKNRLFCTFATRPPGQSETSPVLPFSGSPIRYIVQRFLLLLMVCSLLTPEGASAQIRAGGAFLKIIPGVRNHGLAGSYTGVIDEMHTIYANPGAAGFLREWQWATSYTRWIADSYHLSGLYGKRFTTPWSDKTRFAFGIHYQGVGAFNSTGDPAQAEVGANDALFSLSIGNPLSFLSKNISFGTNIKFLRSQLAGVTAASWMFDFGLMYKSNRFQLNFLNFDYGILSAGVSANHLGQPLNFIGTDTPLPRSFRAGAALNVGSHHGVQIQFSADYSKFRDEVDRFILGAEVFLNNLIALRGGYNFNDNELSSVAAGVSIKLGNSPALPVGKKNAIRFDLAQWQSNTFFVTPLRVGLNHFPLGPEKFNLIDDIYAGEPGTINEPINLSWRASRDPDLYDDVNYVLLLAKDSVGFALRELVTETRKDPHYLLDIAVNDSLYNNALDLLTQENGSASGKITYKFPNDAEPKAVSRTVDISWFKGIDSDRKRSELNYLLKPEPQHEPGSYFWTVLAYDRDQHVRFAEEMGHFWIVSVLKDPWKIAINPPVLQKDYDLELTTMIEHEPLQPNVNFELNSSNLTDSAKRNLDILIEAWDNSGLKKTFIKLGGHTDQTGDSIYNRNLSLKRVNAVKNYLTDMTNIDRDRVFAYGYGEKYLLKDANDFPRAQWKQIHKDNRRVEVYLLKEENKDITNQPIDNCLSIKAVSPGNPVTYNLEVINRGYDPADKLTVSITKPNLAQLVEGSMSLYLNSSMITSGYDSTVTLDSLSWLFSSQRLGYGDTIKIKYDLVFYSISGNPYIFVDTAYVKAKYDRKLRNNVAIADTVYVIGEPADRPSMSPVSDKTSIVTHIVKRGEYLSLIASKYSKPGNVINWSDIYFYEYIYNDSTNIDRIGCCPDSLKVGTVLVIPDKSIGTKKNLRPGVKEAKIVRRPNSKELVGEFSPPADSSSEGKYKFEWLRNNKVVSTETTYTITSADSGNTFQFKVTPVVAHCRCPGTPVFSEPLRIEKNPQ